MVPTKLRVIDRAVPDEGPIASLIVLPRVELSLTPQPLGHHCARALIRLHDGTIWLMELSGAAWTSARLQQAGEVLSAISGNAVHRKSIEWQLAASIGIRSVALRDAGAFLTDIQHWNVPAICQALQRREGRSGLQHEIASELRDALDRFYGGLDADAKRLAETGKRLDADLYNYLAFSPVKLYRRQFAETFPGLVATTVRAESGSVGAELREIVDAGAPVIRSLADSWAVRPRVIRHLVGRPDTLVGSGWPGGMRGLAVLLDSLRPEDLPGDDAAAWARLRRTQETGEVIFERPVWKDATAMSWFRECVFAVNRGGANRERRWLPSRDELQLILGFKSALKQLLRREFVSADVSRFRDVDRAVSEETNRFLFGAASQGLLDMSQAYQRERDVLQHEVANVAESRALWPLITDDFRSKDGRRIVIPLVSREGLREHGKVMLNCLQGAYAEQYLRGGRQGTEFIVGILDAKTRRPLSTAHISVVFGAGRVSYTLDIKQHTAFRNKKPSRQCVTALEELLEYCRKPHAARHVERGWKLIQKIRPYRRESRREQIDVLSTMAVKQAIGVDHVEKLVRRLRERLDGGAEALPESD